MPKELSVIEKCVPVYEEVKGWKESTLGIRILMFSQEEGWKRSCPESNLSPYSCLLRVMIISSPCSSFERGSLRWQLSKSLMQRLSFQPLTSSLQNTLFDSNGKLLRISEIFPLMNTGIR